MDLLQICQNCTHFFTDTDDAPDFGACLQDIAFRNLLPRIWEEENFSCCRELYRLKAFEGDREACSKFEPFDFEPIETPIEEENADIGAKTIIERIRTEDVSAIIRFFYDPDLAVVKKAILNIETYVYLDNKQAFEGLLNYYLCLGPVKSLEEVHLRTKIVDILARRSGKPEVVQAFVNELERSPSNNTTRQLYTLILEHLRGCDGELVHGLLIDLLNKKNYSPKIRERIDDLAWDVITPRYYGPF